MCCALSYLYNGSRKFAQGLPFGMQLNANVSAWLSYVLFSIGNVKPLFKQVFADCWKSHSTCNANWLHAVEYLEIVGIIVGQVIVGFLGDWYV